MNKPCEIQVQILTGLIKKGDSIIIRAGFPLIGKGVEQNINFNNINIQDSPRF